MKTVFTNGCWDLLHSAHKHYLQEVAAMGDFLVIGINSDASVRQIKGPLRPIDNLPTRIRNVAQFLRSIGHPEHRWMIRVFSEPTPEALIREVKPDILVKGSDAPRPLAGEQFVLSYGGQIRIIERLPGISTTDILRELQCDPK